MSITASQIKAIAGRRAVGPGRRNRPRLAGSGRVAKLTTRVRARPFLAQIMTETGGLQDPQRERRL